jgi:hypothetical protein
MYLVARRGALRGLERACALAGAAAVGCVRRYGADQGFEHDFAAWRERPRKVVLRARGGQWNEVLAEPHVLAGDEQGEAVIALPPRGPSDRGETLGRLQAMTSDLGPVPAGDDRSADGSGWSSLTYLLNPSVAMSSGKTMAQVAHAAVAAAERPELEAWAQEGCPARVRIPNRERFWALSGSTEPVARVIDAGLTEVAPGTVTVLALVTDRTG